MPIAKRFALEGAYIFITGRRQSELEEAAAQIGKGVTTVQEEDAGWRPLSVRFGKKISNRTALLQCTLDSCFEIAVQLEEIDVEAAHDVSIGPAGFTLINTFTVDPSRQDEIVQALVDVTEHLMTRLPGFISSTVHASRDGCYVANYVQWRTKDDFLGMFQIPQAKAHMKVVQDLADNVLPVEYEVRYHRHAT